MKNCLFFLVMLFYCSVNAQTLNTNGLRSSVYMGRVIQVIPAASGGYGFEIFFMARLVAFENVNPFTKAPVGLSSQEDAMAIARWHIRQTIGASPHWVVARNKRFPKEVAEQLNIKVR
jgi:hypothetical protein